MAKRIFIWSGLSLVSLGIVLLIWQPDALKTKILDVIAKEVSRSTRYELSIARVSGNIFTGITLENVHVLSKEDHTELLQTQAIKIGVSWWALVHRKIRVESLDLEEPVMRYDLHQKKSSPSSAHDPFPLTYSIRRLTIEKGRIILVNSALPKTKELVFRDISMDARVSSRHLVLNHLAWEVDQGGGSLQGGVEFLPELSGDLRMENHNIPLDRFLAVTGMMPSPPQLPYSGEWAIQTASGTTSVAMKGTLIHGNIALTGLYTPSGLERAHVTWQKTGVGNFSFHMAHGTGVFEISASSADFKATAKGITDWPRRSIEGQASFSNVVWHESRLKQLDAQFSLTPREQHLVLKADQIQLHPEQNPFDVTSSQCEVSGLEPHWQSTTHLKFRNGSTADLNGVISHLHESWELAWQKFAVAFPSAGTWSTDQPGTLLRAPDGRISLAHVSLSNGAQSIKIPEAVMSPKTTHLTLEVHEMDPDPWLKLFAPETSLTSASLNASLRIQGNGQQILVDGFLTGKAKAFDIHTIGLNAKEIDLDVQADHGKIDIKRFTAKTKKGEMTITGGGTWPALDYTLHAHDLALNTATLVKAMGDLDIHVAGTSEYPVVTGHLGIKEAAYAASTKKDKKVSVSPAEESHLPHSLLWKHSTIDMDTHWARNVWYREGVTNIETQGDLRVQKERNTTDLILTGTIRSIRGTYNYYGRDFNMESGQIQFTGTPGIHPLLNIEASYRSDPTVIYLDITGDADKPVLKVRSNPPLPEQDIISVIVFGQPLNELRSRTGTQTTNQQMMQAASGVLGSYVTKELRQTGIAELNVDMLNLQNTPQGSQLMVGRYLSRRLFISYGQAIRGSAEKSVTADYFLTDKWTLQGASDSTQGNYMDFLFRYPLNRNAVTNTPPLPTSPFRNVLDLPNSQQAGFNH